MTIRSHDLGEPLTEEPIEVPEYAPAEIPEPVPA